MSVRVMSWVWDHSEAVGTDRFVLLAIADSADDDGTDAWPSIETLARKTRLDERTVQRSIRRLADAGMLTVEEQAGGSARCRADRRPNRYAVVMRPPETPDASRGGSVSPRTGPRGGAESVTGWQSATQPVLDPPLVETSNEVSTRRQPEKRKLQRRRDALFDALAEACQLAPEDLTPSARGALNRALKDLRAVGATPDEIHRRAGQYRQMWPAVTLTPTALARHWAECTPRAGPLDQRQAEIARVAAWAESIDREVS